MPRRCSSCIGLKIAQSLSLLPVGRGLEAKPGAVDAGSPATLHQRHGRWGPRLPSPLRQCPAGVPLAAVTSRGAVAATWLGRRSLPSGAEGAQSAGDLILSNNPD